ncbi:unnamed protein product [Dovyalis caffra]|uniref:Uncharacterized protein n=1 Tax=Dovyalis caffra TaxID=77055 RepID=A0AAV1R297_9ROSI|nr:unnamed protein product [Dovyalis caffra]
MPLLSSPLIFMIVPVPLLVFWAAYHDETWFPAIRNVAAAKEGEARKAYIEQAREGLVLLEDAFRKCSKRKGFFGGD